MATQEIPIILQLDEQEVMRQRQAIKHLTKAEQKKLIEEGFKRLQEKLGGVSFEALIEKNPHLEETLKKKITPEPNEMSDAFEKLLTEKPTRPLLVNGEKYELKKGVETPNGVYKNGWKIHDIKGDGKWKQLNIYTARQNEVDYEMRVIFKKQKNGEWKLCVLEGFDGIDLMKIDQMGSNEVYVLDYLTALLKRD